MNSSCNFEAPPLARADILVGGGQLPRAAAPEWRRGGRAPVGLAIIVHVLIFIC